MPLDIDPKKYGAKSPRDTGLILFGTGFGGMADAIFNIAAYAEPFVVGPLCGFALLSFKRLLFDKVEPDPKEEQ